VENNVDGGGWRAYVTFDTLDANLGNLPVDIGTIPYVFSEDGTISLNTIHNLYEFDTCHGHYHFNHYATFQISVGDVQTQGGKKGYCLEDTDRLVNAEWSPMVNRYYTCKYQGVSVGWADRYNAGLPGQYRDVTNFLSSTSHTGLLTVSINPENLVCEGILLTDPNGEQMWVQTNVTTNSGLPIEKPACLTTDGALDNNVETTLVTVPPKGHSYITKPCDSRTFGPKRACDIQPRSTFTFSRERVAVTCHSTSTKPQVVRLCPYSSVLATGIPCRSRDSFANFRVPAGGSARHIIERPVILDAAANGHPFGFSVYSSGYFSSEGADSSLTCMISPP
jgi:hypothetical protein